MLIRDKDLFECIYNIENLYHAWNKAKNVYDNESDFVFNRQEISEYEANLQCNLQNLSERIKGNRFQMKPMLQMPLPKAGDKEKVSRQHFYIYLEDQIVWLAVINVIGPLLDDKMPYWSFGNRLYMPIWKENDDGSDKKRTKFGTYRPSSRKIYRNWTSSWPLFRKAVAITAKKMLHCNNNDLNEEDIEEIDIYNNAPTSFKILTWDRNYWNKKKETDDNIFYATVDLEKFYPSIDAKTSILSNTVLTYIGITPAEKSSSDLFVLLTSLLSFTIENVSSDNIDSSTIILGDRNEKDYFGIPTGLFVAGFLANIAMLEIDREVQEKISASRRIAHFRFVDDHVFLAYSIEELYTWIHGYEEIIFSYLSRIKINAEKIEPEAFKLYFEGQHNNSLDDSTLTRAAEQCKLDTFIASPFSTLTLKKLSGLNKDPFELMDESEKANLLRDIEHLLVTEFPDAEIRKDTRVSWAAMLLVRLVPEIDFDVNELVHINQKIESAPGNTDKKELHAQFAELEKIISDKRNNLNKRVFSLLLKALKDNIAKPKIWKRCIDFCRTTGYDGLPLLLKQLDEDSSLSDNGKTYILSSIANTVSSCLLTCITINKSTRYSPYEKKNASKFAENIIKGQEQLFSLAEQYDLFYSESVLEQLNMALSFYTTETEKSSEVSYKDVYAYACYIWYALERTSNAFQTVPPKSLVSIEKLNLQNDKNANLIRKLQQMYKHPLDSFQKSSDTTLARWIQAKNKILPRWVRSGKNEFDLLTSEWTCLEIILKAIHTIQTESPDNEIFRFNKVYCSDFEFHNCSPHNFKLSIASDELPKEFWGWSEYKKFFKDNINLEYTKVVTDERYDYIFFNTYGNVSLDKRQVCSFATLLITLLSDSLVFPPLFNRRDPIDRSYNHVLLKTETHNFSSYTRAILIGALSYREFEKSSFSFFDSVILNRDDDTTLDPIRIENLTEMEKHISAAQNRLERYQLSLENQVPRQLIPISLKNLSRSYNPYVGGDE